ncbi:MAG TPA: hypothetical protein VD789_06730 [Thermomicrobiales bacterium]|nr:hypothetical protein [Thermomicrobiales bacterium]
MYVARFSYSIKPIDRERALGLLRQEVRAASEQGLETRLLVPLTRPPGGAALQYEVVLPDLDRFETFREQGLGGEDETRAWLRDLSAILLEPPTVELLRIADSDATAGSQTTKDRIENEHGV